MTPEFRQTRSSGREQALLKLRTSRLAKFTAPATCRRRSPAPHSEGAPEAAPRIPGGGALASKGQGAFCIMMVEREGFEPSKAKAARFTVWSRWPLGYLSP